MQNPVQNCTTSSLLSFFILLSFILTLYFYFYSLSLSLLIVRGVGGNKGRVLIFNKKIEPVRTGGVGGVRDVLRVNHGALYSR